MTPGDLRGCTLLLVDDEEANLDLLEGILALEGYRSVVRTTDARQALPLFEACRPDLVLLDLHMPHRSGFEVLDDIRARVPPGGYLPVLVLTADATPEARERALSRGARDFLTKPLDAVEVLLRVRNLLETRQLHRFQSEARERAQLLAEASRVLGASLDSTTVLSRLPQLLAPGFADACGVLLDGDEGLSLAGASAVDAQAEAALGELARAGDGDGAVSGDGGRSRIVAPLRVQGQALGALALVRTGGRTFNDADEELAREIAARAGLAVENARLFADAQWAMRARERMLQVVAHDLRNPLSVVVMYAEMLEAVLPPEGDATQREALVSIARSTERMQRMVEDLLDASRLQHGTFAIEPAPQSPHDLFRHAEATFRPLAERAGLSLAVRGDGAEAAPVVVDAGRVLQVLSNLVGNAVKFTPAGGRVTLAWSRAEDELRVEVADTGPGIAPEQLPHVFGAFWQCHERDRRGIGLGLWIAQAIVEAHGGRIWVDSPPGEGATFRFVLPAAARSPLPLAMASPGDENVFA